MWIIGAILIVIALSGLAAMSTIAQPTITVFADRSLGETSPLLFGANYCYHDCGTTSWDCTTGEPVNIWFRRTGRDQHLRPLCTIDYLVVIEYSHVG